MPAKAASSPAALVPKRQLLPPTCADDSAEIEGIS
jgi:hypothetical protein